MREKTGPWWVCLSVLALTLAISGPVFASSDMIEAVEVDLQILGGNIHPILKQRVNRAVSEVAQTALVGRPIPEVDQFAEAYQESLGEVYNSTISGFKLERLEIVPGKVSSVQVMLRAAGERVRSVITEWSLSEPLTDWATEYLRSQLELSLPQVGQAYHGVPVESFPWVGPALSAEAKSLLPKIPGFAFKLVITPGVETQVSIQAVPELPQIYALEIGSDSHTLPVVFLRQLSRQLETGLAGLRGLPVAFVAQQSTKLEQQISQLLTETAPYKWPVLRYEVDLTVGAVTTAEVRVESARYKMLWEASVDFGRDIDPQFRFEAGWHFHPSARLLVGAELPVTSLNWETEVGVGVDAFGGDLVFLYNLADNKPLVRYEYYLDGAQRIRLKRDWAADEWEIAYGIKNTGYITTEIVGNDSGVWLRLVGNL